MTLPVGSFTIVPVSIGFAGILCLLSWSSDNSETATINNGVGAVLPTGSKFVSVTDAAQYTITFGNALGTTQYVVNTTTVPDPSNVIVMFDNQLEVKIARNVNAGVTSVNQTRMTGNGSPSFIITSQALFVAPPLTLLSGEDLGIL